MALFLARPTIPSLVSELAMSFSSKALVPHLDMVIVGGPTFPPATRSQLLVICMHCSQGTVSSALTSFWWSWRWWPCLDAVLLGQCDLQSSAALPDQLSAASLLLRWGGGTNFAFGLGLSLAFMKYPTYVALFVVAVASTSAIAFCAWSCHQR